MLKHLPEIAKSFNCHVLTVDDMAAQILKIFFVGGIAPAQPISEVMAEKALQVLGTRI